MKRGFHLSLASLLYMPSIFYLSRCHYTHYIWCGLCRWHADIAALHGSSPASERLIFAPQGTFAPIGAIT